MKTPTQMEQKLTTIGRRIRNMDADNHTPLLAAIVGSLKAQAGFNEDSVRAAVNAIDIAVEDFENNLQ